MAELEFRASPAGALHHDKSAALLRRGAKVTPGGVNSMRRKIDPPVCFRRARGAYAEDLDGNVYLDMHAAYGAIFLGHCYPAVDDRVREAMRDFVLPGIGTTELEVLVAEKLVHHLPAAQQVVICNTGSEATQNAIRLMRAATGRTLIVKAEGHYHGFYDYVLINTRTPADRIGTHHPMSAGTLPAGADATLIVPFNDLEAISELFARAGEDIAGVIMEPVNHNSGSILPVEGYLAGVQRLCQQHGALFCIDEVLTGFRDGLAGYHGICGVTPDLITLGKAIANGYTTAALGGRRDLLELFDTTPTGTVVFGGTHNGNSIGMAAALAAIETLETEPVHQHVCALGDRMRSGLRSISEELGVPVVVSGHGSVYTMLFMHGPLRSYADVARNDRRFFVAYTRELVERGLLQVPENIGRNHISYSHTAADIDTALEISRDALKATIKKLGLPRRSVEMGTTRD